jgi:HK97 family phage portal protein
MELVTKEHSADMNMVEFAQWYQTTFGHLTLKSALQQAAFLLCCDIISQDMGKAPLHLCEMQPNGTPRVLAPKEHEVAALLADEPNQRHTWTEFVEMMGLWHAATQNSLAIVKRDRLGSPIALIPLQTGRITERIYGSELFYDITATTQQEMALLGAGMITVPERDMIHVRGRMFDGMDGYSTMEVGQKTLDVGTAIDKYRERLFDDDGQIRGVFTRPDSLEALPDVLFDRLKQQFRALMTRSAQTNEPIVLEGGVKFEKISVNPQEAELSEQFAAQIVATGRLFRIPPHKLFHLEGVKYENLETMEKAYVGDTMIPICKRHEDRYKKTLLSKEDRRRGLFFLHDREALMVKDTKAETERLTKALERGGIEIDEFRGRLGFNPLPNKQGQARLIPVNMNVVDRGGEVIIGGQAVKEEPADKTDEEPEKDGQPALRLVADNS